MGYYEFLQKTFGNWSPLQLAILIDILMLIPFIDFIITIPLQLILWNKPEVDNEFLKWINIGYDTIADFAIPVIGDMFPLNTVTVALMMIKNRL